MPTMERIRAIFRPDAIGGFDFSRAPGLISSARSMEEMLRTDSKSSTQWSRVQEGFLERARQKDMYPLANLQQVKEGDDAFFQTRGPLLGSVLDIGGGWGLYREWWSPGAADVFVVHDPGVERHLRGPYPTHLQCYEKAFSLPMTFVEGPGEALPYQDQTFDTALVTATLDHCADPQRVLSEAFRCLKPGGRMLVLQSCHARRPVRTGAHLFRRGIVLLGSPGKLVKKIRSRLFGPPVHLHHFTVPDLTQLFVRAGFSNVTSRPVYRDVYAFEGIKP